MSPASYLTAPPRVAEASIPADFSPPGPGLGCERDYFDLERARLLPHRPARRTHRSHDHRPEGVADGACRPAREHRCPRPRHEIGGHAHGKPRPARAEGPESRAGGRGPAALA